MDQLISKFKETEAKYNDLKAQLGRGEIAVDEAKAEIKKLMIQDDTGTYWMMGGKSGKWYKHVDNQWQEADPFAELFPPVEEPAPEPEPAFEPAPQAQEREESPVTLETYNIDDKVARHETVIEKAQHVDFGGLEADAGATAGDGEVYTLSGDDQDAGAAVKLDMEAGMEIENGAAGDTGAADTNGAGEALFADINVGNGASYTEEEKSYTAEDPRESSGIKFADEEEAGADPGISFADVGNGGEAAAGAADSFGLETSAGGDFDGIGQTDPSFEAVGSASTVDALGGSFGQDAGGLHEDFAGGGLPGEAGGAATIEFAGSGGAGLGADSAGGPDFEETGGLEGAADTSPYATMEAETPGTGISIDLDKEEAAMDEPGATVVIESEITGEPPEPQASQDFQSELEYQSEQAGAPAEPVIAVPTPPVAPAGAMDSADMVNCVICQSRIPPIAVYCSFCGANQKELDAKKARKARKMQPGAAVENELVLKSINVMSFLFFLGGLGLVAGVILGAMFGVIMDFMAGLHGELPLMLQEVRGGGVGGLIFAAIGGIGGFIAAAFMSLVLSAVYNLIAFVFGGIRFKIKS
jgi:hypothetical protein